MPNYKKHLVGGFATYSVLLFLLRSFNPTFIYAIEWLGLCLFGSLFPDVDTKSKIQKIFYISLLLTLFLLMSQNKLHLCLFLSFLGFSPLIVNHRGLFHKAWFLIAIATIFGCILIKYNYMNSTIMTLHALFFIAGALSHIVLDMGIKQLFKL